MIDDERILTRPLTPRQLAAIDTVAAGGYALVLLTLALGTASGAGERSVPVSAIVAVVLAMGLPLAFRRRWPVPVFAVVFSAALVGLALGVVRDGFVGAGFALYMVAVSDRAMSRELTRLVAAIAIVGLGLVVVAGSPLPVVADAGPILVGLVVLTGSWTIGRAVRERRRFTARSAAELVERAIAEERLRIARDLHDVVAHGLSLIVIKAATARHVAAVRPGEADGALGVIETTGRSALAEMRTILDVLRADEPAADKPELAPAPALDQLPALAERVAKAGVRVELDVSGTEALPSGVALSAYRIVQEALTNVVKHAAPAHCRVGVIADGATVRVEVEDDGARAAATDASTSPGRGLVGMRERVRMLGGEFSAGPLPGRGFRVAARIPYASTAAGGTRS